MGDGGPGAGAGREGEGAGEGEAGRGSCGGGGKGQGPGRDGCRGVSVDRMTLVALSKGMSRGGIGAGRRRRAATAGCASSMCPTGGAHPDRAQGRGAGQRHRLGEAGGRRHRAPVAAGRRGGPLGRQRRGWWLRARRPAGGPLSSVGRGRGSRVARAVGRPARCRAVRAGRSTSSGRDRDGQGSRIDGRGVAATSHVADDPDEPTRPPPARAGASHRGLTRGDWTAEAFATACSDDSVRFQTAPATPVVALRRGGVLSGRIVDQRRAGGRAVGGPRRRRRRRSERGDRPPAVGATAGWGPGWRREPPPAWSTPQAALLAARRAGR